jgi:acyl dehydratase
VDTDIKRWIGYAFEPYTYTVERGKIREFIEAIGDGNPIYVDPKAAAEEGFQDTPLPPTFATAIDFWGGPDFFELCEQLELNMLKVLHGEQEYQYFGDIYPGDTITAVTKVVDAKTKSGGSGGMNIFVLETLYRNQYDDCILIARETVLERF